MKSECPMILTPSHALPRRRGRVTCLVSSVLLLGVAIATAVGAQVAESSPTADVEAERRRLHHEWVDRLARGQEVDSLRAALEALPAASLEHQRLALTSPGDDGEPAAELTRAIRALRAEIVRTSGAETLDTAHTTNLLRAVRAADARMIEHFEAVRERLTGAGYSSGGALDETGEVQVPGSQVLARLSEAQRLYSERMAELRSILDAAFPGEPVDRQAQPDGSGASVAEPGEEPGEEPREEPGPLELRAAEAVPFGSPRSGETEVPTVRTPASREAVEAATRRLRVLFSAPEAAPFAEEARGERIHGVSLPYHRDHPGARALSLGPPITPTYSTAADILPAGADLAFDLFSPLSVSVRDQAEALGFEAARIFDFVRNEIHTEWYAGLQKGAEATLRQRAGNDADQSALLVALLRASGVPARFVVGVAERDIEELALSIGVTEAQVPRALREAGVPAEPVLRGGRVAAMQLEQVWVSARPPYGNYRGAVVDLSGAAWVPLAPASKRVSVTPPTGILRGAVDVDQEIAAYLSRQQPEDVVDTLVRRLEVALAGGALEAELGSREIVREDLGLLPSSLPFEEVVVLEEAAAIPERLVHRARFLVRAETGEELLRFEVPSARLAGERVTLSWIPATLEDHQTLNLWGSLYSVPAYLLNVRPQISIAGLRAAVGTGSLPLASQARVVVEWVGPSSAPAVSGGPLASTHRRSIDALAGGLYAFGFGAGSYERQPSAEDLVVGEDETLAAVLLAQRALSFGIEWDEGERLLGGLLGVTVLRPAPSLAVTSLAIDVEFAVGLPQALRVEGVELDAIERVVHPFADPTQGGDPEAVARSFTAISALHGSSREHFGFEDDFMVESISADRGLGLARESGIAITTLDASNVDALLPTLSHSEEVKAAVLAWAQDGLVVEIPQTEVELRAWRGSVFRVIDQASGAAGYFLSGGLAGGETVEPFADWVLDDLADALAGAGQDTNPDPLSVTSLSRVEETDGLMAEVSERLPQRIGVVARDDLGRAVVGALVEFVVVAGDATVRSENGAGESASTTSDEAGIAWVEVLMGTDTSVNGELIRIRESDEEATLAGQILIEAVAQVEDDEVVIDQPFREYMLPGPPARLVPDRPVDQVHTAEPATFAETLRVFLYDAFDNPVSNAPVVFDVPEAPYFENVCPNQEDYFQPLPGVPPAGLFRDAQVFDPAACAIALPRHGQCGGPVLETVSGPRGAQAGVILGNDAVRPSLIRVSYPVAGDGVVFSETLEYNVLFSQGNATDPDGNPISPCSNLTSFRFRMPRPVDEFGNMIAAARPGESPDADLSIVLEVWNPDPYIDDQGDVRERTTGRWITGTAVDLPELLAEPGALSNGGSLSAPLFVPESEGSEFGTYFVRPTAGPVPVEHTVKLEPHHIRWNAEFIDEAGNPLVIPRELFSPAGGLPWLTFERPALFAVQPEVLGTEPEQTVITADSRLGDQLTVAYRIEPADYHALSVEVAFIEVSDANGVETGRLLGTAQGTERQGEGTALIPRGLEIVDGASYAFEVVLNRGSSYEVRSEPFPLPVTERIFRDVKQYLRVTQEVDIPNERAFSQADAFEFVVRREAAVTLEVRPIDAMTPDGDFELGAPQTVIGGEVLLGQQRRDLGPGDLAPGSYRFELTGVATDDGFVETHEGSIEVAYEVRDRAPVGHAMVKGVNLFDGHLVVSRSDLSYPGRGKALSFSRTWSSNHGNAPGTLGVGWSHPYDSRLILTPHGIAIVIGAEGSGMRFEGDGQGGWTPLRGYHGTLVQDTDNGAFDFFTRDGSRYRYFLREHNHFELDFIEDTNGNRTDLLYSGAGENRVLTSVVDSSGRSLDFTNVRRDFALWSGQVITAITGPGNQSVTFGYDIHGNLTSAVREGGLRSERYGYNFEVGDTPLWEKRHLLVEVENQLNTALSSYVYIKQPVGVQGDIQVPTYAVDHLVEPQGTTGPGGDITTAGGTTRFVYNTLALADRSSGQLETQVESARTDGDPKVTRWFLNGYGSPQRTVDPLGNESLMTWDDQDILLTSRTDANGVTTTFTYDSEGNLLSEETLSSEWDGTERTFTQVNTYWPSETFSLPAGGKIKNRLRTRTDRNGNTTSFGYDNRGNLIEESIQVTGLESSESLTTTHAYSANGDRIRTTNPRGFTTTFTYDVYGNLARVIEPSPGGTTETVWDERSLPLSRTDQEGRVTDFTYDGLGRLLRTDLPRAAGEAGRPSATASYDDANNVQTETDPAGRTTTTQFDLQGRVVRIENAVGGTMELAYDEAGNKTLETGWFDADTLRTEVTFQYDDADRLVRRDEPLDRTTTYGYDPAGNVIRETLLDQSDGSFPTRETLFGYDGLNRQDEITQVFGTAAGDATTRRRYDGEGNLVEEIDPEGRVSSSRYDELNRRIEFVEPPYSSGAAKTTQWIYDGSSNLIEERRLNQRYSASGSWDIADQIRNFSYDALDRVETQTDAEDREPQNRPTTFRYDKVGNVVAEIDPNLNRVEHSYDARNRRTTTTVHLDRVTSATHPEGLAVATTVRTFDAVGNLLTEEFPNGNTQTSNWDGLNRLLNTSDDMGAISSFEYDARGNRTAETNARGHRTELDYDALDRVVERRLPTVTVPATQPRVETFTYDVVGNQLSVTDVRGFTVDIEYDRLNRETRRILPPTATGFGNEGSTARYETSQTYDRVGNVLTRTNARGLTTSFEYDGLNRLVRQQDPGPLSYVQTFQYDAIGNQVEHIDRRGIAQRFTFDRENRDIAQSRDGLQLLSRRYDANGNKVSETDANGATTSWNYDERDLALVENRPETSTTVFHYDAMGSVILEIDPVGRESSRAYDLRQRLSSETTGAGETTLYEYDLAGNRTLTQRPEGGTWRNSYDEANRIQSVTSPAGTTSYTYDEAGNLLEHLDAENSATTFSYDALSRQATKTMADSSAEAMRYDENGNITGLRDAVGQEITRSYDVLDRETSVTYPEPVNDPDRTDFLSEISMTYDPSGNPTLIEEQYTGATGTRVTTRTYDTFDRLETVTDPQGETLSYRYDPNGNRTRLEDSDGLATTYTFDGLNRPTTVTTDGGTTEYRYYRDSRLERVTYPNGTTADTTYDLAGRTETITNRWNSALVSSYSYEYDRNGNRTVQVEENGGAAETTTYSYDLADRLTQVVYPDKTTTYTYDGVGNRLTEVDTSTSGVTRDRTLSYDSRHRIESMIDALDATQSVTYSWDPNGNLRTRSQGSETREHFYDSRDQLTEVRTNGLLSGYYQYDYQGLRIRKSGGPEGTVRYVYDDQSVLQQTDDNGFTLSKYDYGPDRLLSLNNTSEGRQFYLFDALGSISNLIQPDGALKARYRWDAWGNLRSQVGSSANVFGFTGHELDDETGLYYAKARFYDPELGRFLTEDPVFGDLSDPPSLHWYTYGKVNPTVWVDPDGRVEVRGMPSAPEGLPDEVVEKAERAQEMITELDDAVIEKAAEAADKLEELPGGSWLAERTEDLAAVASAGLNLLRIPPSAVQAVDLALEINANNQQSPITMIAEPEALPHRTRGFEANQQLVEEAKDSAVLILESAVEVGYEASRGDREAQIRTKRTVLEVGTAAGGLVRGGSKFVRAFRGKRARAARGASAPPESATRFPDGDSQLEHIFEDRPGHLPDTPENRNLLIDVADDPAATLGTDRFGNEWSARTLDDGTQAWVQTRDGIVQNGGLNLEPRTFNSDTGLSRGKQ